MKTVIIYDFGGPLQFIVAEGDLSHLNNIYVNHINSDRKLQDELCDMMYDPVSGDPTDLMKSAVEIFPTEEVVKGAKVIVTGFMLY